MEKYKILLVDDSKIFMEGVKLILKEAFDVVGTATCREEAMDFLKKQKPDVILMDISIQEYKDGIDIAREIKIAFPEIKVIQLSHYKSSHLIMESIYAKCDAYLSKDTSEEELVSHIFSVIDDKNIFFGETIDDAVVDVCVEYSKKSSKKPYKLSKREVEILQLLSEEYTTKEIASKLYIEPTTVESHKEKIKEKLNCRTIAGIVAYAIKHNLILGS